MSEPDKDLLRKAVARGVAGLTGTARLTVVELAADGLTTFKIHRDDNGVPRGRRWSVAWTDLTVEPNRGEDARQAVLSAADAATGEVIVVCSFPDGPEAGRALEWLQEAYAAPTFTVDVPVTTLVRDVLADDPLSQSYDLVVMRPDPVTGRLVLATTPLFPIGTRPRTRTDVTVRCEPGDEYGTAFAVVTWQGREPRLLSVRSARLPPGRYEVTAELVRPGRVTFTGLPELAPDPRGWAELVQSVPSRLPPPAGPAHLICAVEVCGADAKVAERLSRAHQVITYLSGELADLLRVSLVAYGAHSFDRSAKDRPVEVAAWQATADQALDALRVLEERGAITQGYPYHPHAAQVEDMLEAVARRLDPDGAAQVVLLTVGDRPPHPARADRSRILPCPHRHDWEVLLGHLEHLPGAAFGAICDQPAEQAHPVWRRLGARTLAHLNALDLRGLAAGLGLTAPAAGRVPFPLIDETE
ncbi:hypothetical protein [Microbispora sp. NPDC049125]|uniref:hypothetical protein n=1 Tax=Microbispora sp. NPDC049125 TaxID=3154929 RepID=UPI0034656454